MTAGEPKAAECGHWLILADQGGTAQSLADCLHRKGQEAIFVFSGKSYEHSDPRQRQVRPEEPDDFRRLLDEAGAARAVWGSFTCGVSMLRPWRNSRAIR